MKYEVWSEGYRATGQSATAFKLINPKGDGTWEAETFSDACILAMKSSGYSYQDIDKFYNPVKNSFWGCRFFDNEKDAKRSFG